MTKPFDFTNLAPEYSTVGPDSPGDQEDLAAIKEKGQIFPNLAFNRPRADKVGKIERTYTAKDLARAVEEACQATAREVELQTKSAISAELNHRQAEALEAIRDQLQNSDVMLGQWMSEAVTMTQSLTKLMAKAIVPKALELQPLADIDHMMHQILSNLVDHPRIEIRIASELSEETDNLLGRVAEETSFHGEIVTVVDPKLGPGDAQITWKNGVADRSLECIQAKVDMLIDAWFDHQSECHFLGKSTDRQIGQLEQTDAMSKSTATEHQSSEERPQL